MSALLAVLLLTLNAEAFDMINEYWLWNTRSRNRRGNAGGLGKNREWILGRRQRQTSPFLFLINT